jgi:hypothetical protein
MAQAFTLTQEEYESLVALARAGTAEDANKSRSLETWLQRIEKRNGVVRDLVVVLWQELDQPLPTGTFFPTVWPPTLKASIELVTRPVARVDVDKLLSIRAKNPVSILCTRDPAGVVGLTPIDQFFVQ